VEKKRVRSTVLLSAPSALSTPAGCFDPGAARQCAAASRSAAASTFTASKPSEARRNHGRQNRQAPSARSQGGAPKTPNPSSSRVRSGQAGRLAGPGLHDSSGMPSASASASKGRWRLSLIGSLELGGHLVDASLGVFVVLARRPERERPYWQTAGEREHACR
jgi:hypothetical protein